MFRTRPTQSGTTTATATTTQGEEHVAEAVPIVAAHIDEELLTRKKYFEENLRKQTEELKAARARDEQELREAYQKQGGQLRKNHFDRLAQYQKDLEGKARNDSELQAEEQAELESRFEKVRQVQEQQEEQLKQKYADQRQARSTVSWLLTSSPFERHSFEAKERSQREKELKSIEEISKQELSTLEEKHHKEMENIARGAESRNAFWTSAKPILISAMLGGAVGLLLTPENNRS